MQYLTAFSNYGMKLNLVSVMKYDKYTMISAYKLAAAMFRVLELKAVMKIGNPGPQIEYTSLRLKMTAGAHGYSEILGP